MSATAADTQPKEALAGYDGSPAAANAIEIGARLLPDLAARIVHLWSPPFGSSDLRRRLQRSAASLDELVAMLEREGAAEAERVADHGVTLARAAGWDAEPLVRRTYGGEGFELARIAQELPASAIVVGSRGLSGLRAVLGSVSDLVVHHSPVPALVVPHPSLVEERNTAASGPVLVAYDGSEGAREALAGAASLFPGRELIAATVAGGDAGVAGTSAAAEAVTLDPAGPGGRGVAEALARGAAERGAALICVGSRGRSAPREILLGSVALAVLHHGERPALVVPGGDRLAGP